MLASATTPRGQVYASSQVELDGEGVGALGFGSATAALSPAWSSFFPIIFVPSDFVHRLSCVPKLRRSAIQYLACCDRRAIDTSA